MARLSRKNQRRIIASVLTGVFMMQPTMLTVAASEIVSGGTALTPTGNTYNISPESIDNKVGFREYSKFNLTEGDIANLLFNGDMQTFVNMMHSDQFNINGVLNTMKDGNFYNGKAVFISPKGLVVGASGVLNVGSLGVYQPDPANNDFYNNLRNNKTAANFNAFETAGKAGAGQFTGAGGNNDVIKIDGKIMAADEVAIVGPNINIANNAGIMAGVKESELANYVGEGRALELFNELVNVNLANGNKFESTGNGQIIIKSTGNGIEGNNNTGTVINGTVRNFANGSNAAIKIENLKGAQNGINIGATGRIVNTNGLVDVYNQEGNLNVAGTVTNYGNSTVFTNSPQDNGITSGLNISGTVNTNNGNVKVENFGNNGLTVSGNINSQTANLQNGFNPNVAILNPHNTGAMNISGNINTQESATLWNTEYGEGGMNISGVVNAGTTAQFTNDGAGGLNVTANAGNTNNIIANGLEMYNTGANGLNINGKVQNTGAATVYNYAGGTQGLNIGGTFANTGAATFTNDGANGLNVSGNVTSSTLNMTNNGDAGMNFESGANVTSNGNSEFKNTNGAMHAKNGSTLNNTAGTAHYLNTGNGGMLFEGTVNNTGTTNAENKAGEMRLGGHFTNNGVSTFTNDGTALNVTGNITSSTLNMTNNGAAGMNFESGANVTSNGNSEFKNTNGAMHAKNGSSLNNTAGTAHYLNTGNGGMLFEGTVNNTGTTNAENKAGEMRLGGHFTNDGASTFTNDGTALNVTGNITNNSGKLTLTNNGAGGLNVKSTGRIDAKNQIAMTNNGDAGFNVEGQILNTGNGEYVNNKGGFNAKAGSEMRNNGGTAHYYNEGNDGMTFAGTVENTGTTNAENSSGQMLISGSFTNTGASRFYNTGSDGMNITGSINNSGDKLTLTNIGSGGLNIRTSGLVSNTDDTTITNNGNEGLNVAGRIQNGGELEITNTGSKGFNTTGTINSDGNITTTNTGSDGTNLASSGRITGQKNININDESAGGVNIKGIVKADKQNINIKANGGNVTIGDNTSNNNYVDAKQNVDIDVKNGSILNFGVEKILVKAGGDLTMNAENGTIGLPVQQNACTGSGCTGIGPKADGARDFTKSINAQVAGKVNAHTKDAAEAGKDLVINYASIGADMKIDTIKADGRVILTVDDDYGNTNNGKRYSMINARPADNTDTNIEGWGVSLIADKNIGSADNKVTFIQNRAEDGYKMDALANNSIYLKENSFNDADYGRNKEIKTNEVCTMIAREGDLDVEFAGNTKIKNITAEGDLKVVTRGKTIEIDNLGHIVDPSVEPNDYFGPRNYGLNDNPTLPDGGNNGVYGKEVLPNNATVKALDINHNIRPTETTIKQTNIDNGDFEAYAGSTAIVHNAVLDKGKMEVVADNVYANGIEAHFNRDGFTKKENPLTNKTEGVFNPSDGPSVENDIPTGKAVRPEDIVNGRDIHERNYYYPTGNGNMNNPIVIVDKNNDGIADATPLALETDKPILPPDNPVVPTITPNNPGTPGNTPVADEDGSLMFIQRKIDESDLDNIDKRQYMRFGVSGSELPIALEQTNNGVTRLLDVSRGGVALAHDGSLKVGDIVPLHMTYGDLDVHAQVKVVSATTARAGAEFVNLDKATANQLLYLNIVIDNWHNKLTLK